MEERDREAAAMLGSGTERYATHLDRRSNGRRSGVVEAARRFGGIDVAASLCGMLVSLALLVIVGGTALAISAAIGVQRTADGGPVSISGGTLLATAGVALVSFLVGGWAAGRMARYSGPLNGALVVFWFLLVSSAVTFSAHLAAVRTTFLTGLDMSQPRVANWFVAEPLTATSIVVIVLLAAVIFLAAVLGGAWGQRMHRRADDVIVSAEDDVVQGAFSEETGRLAS